MFNTLPSIKPAKRTAPLTRKLVLHPVAMLAFFWQTLFYFLFFSEHRYSLQSDLDQFLLTFGWGIVYYGSFYFFMGAPVRALVSRNVPLAWCYVIYFVVMATIEASFGHFLFRLGEGGLTFLWHVFSTVAAVVPAIIICSFFFEQRMRAIFGIDPESVPYWLPIKNTQDLLLAQIPREKRGKILQLRSANQYVEVITTKGTCELRTTLKSLLENMPGNNGIHLHRSYWLHRDQIKEFGYENGNPFVIDTNGVRVPVSRSKVPIVKKILAIE